jgi:transcriptional regulator with XRE-family HTH domain
MTVGAALDDDNKIDGLIGARVRSLREGRRMSQTTLGAAIGVSFQQVQKYERGANRIAASTLFQIARILGVSPSDFFEHLQPGSDAVEASRLSDPETRTLLQGFARIRSAKVRGKIVDLVETLSADD